MPKIDPVFEVEENDKKNEQKNIEEDSLEELRNYIRSEKQKDFQTQPIYSKYNGPEKNKNVIITDDNIRNLPLKSIPALNKRFVSQEVRKKLSYGEEEDY